MEDNNILSELKELQSYKELGSIKVLFIFVAIYENWYIFIRDPVDVGGAFENCFDLSEVGWLVWWSELSKVIVEIIYNYFLVGGQEKGFTFSKAWVCVRGGGGGAGRGW